MDRCTVLYMCTDSPVVPVLSLDALTLEDGTDTPSWNVGKEAICAVQQCRTEKILSGCTRICHDIRYIKTSGLYNCCRRRQINRSLSRVYIVSKSTRQTTLYRFDISLTMHNWNKPHRQPTRCKNNGLLIISISSSYFGRWFLPSSGALDCVYSLW
jgi:hypothetical protein